MADWLFMLGAARHHLIWAATIVGLALFGAGRTLGLGGAWERTSLVRTFPVLQ